jgi:hypothetical protein
MDATSVGLWLIGVGSLGFVTASLLASPRAASGMTFSGPITQRRDRLGFSAQTSSGCAVACGSLLVAIGELPDWWVILSTVAIATAVGWLVSSWKVHEYWAAELARTAFPTGDPEFDKQFDEHPTMRDIAETVRLCATWRWCLRHPLSTSEWSRYAPRHHKKRA